MLRFSKPGSRPRKGVERIAAALLAGDAKKGTRRPLVSASVAAKSQESKNQTHLFPDRMYINAEQIVFVEPVGPDSKVAQLINQAKQ